MQSKTIEIFLPEGEPTGVRVADIKNHTGQLIAFPRKQLPNVSDINREGIYFLFGTDKELGDRDLVYIGQAKNCQTRLKQHHQDLKMDFWNTAAVFTSKDHSFGTTEIESLERLAVAEARQAGRYVVKNDKLPPVSTLSLARQSQVDEQLECVKLLLPVIGYPVFITINLEDKTEDVLWCRSDAVTAQGKYTDTGMVVFKGSQARPTVTPSCAAGIVKLRGRLLDGGILKTGEGVFTFAEDYTFTSPSMAASVVLGRNANGWTEWKNAEGQTLDAKYRNAESFVTKRL